MDESPETSHPSQLLKTAQTDEEKMMNELMLQTENDNFWLTLSS